MRVSLFEVRMSDGSGGVISVPYARRGAERRAVIQALMFDAGKSPGKGRVASIRWSRNMWSARVEMEGPEVIATPAENFDW